MTSEGLNARIDLPVELLEDRVSYRINESFPSHKVVISPRELDKVTKTCIMHDKLLNSLIRNVPLRGNPGCKPYERIKLDVSLAEPRTFEIGQTFVLKRKIIELMTQMPQKIFDGFCLSGVSSAPPLEMYGIDRQQREAIAFYIPPLIEYHSSRPTLLDGIHRSYLCKGAGTAINAVHLYNVQENLPFDPLSWQSCDLSEEKPSKERRYRNLQTERFRDLTYVGIDG